jgi:hypothetical protein
VLGCHLPNSPWSGKIKLFPAKESLISVDGKMANLFLPCVGGKIRTSSRECQQQAAKKEFSGKSMRMLR